ncbi:MAG: aminotransferase class V-fold PLP-dependent enzyme [Candidatus Pelethousia sp.]|nr:aminotransferase class V-fold PLP-dependent enzyme [Candidatus Pelethousia sp.]
MIYFDNGSTSFPKAPGVGEAMAALIATGAFNINRGGYEGAYRVADMVLDTREQICRLLDWEDPKNVAFTGNVTQSLNLILKGYLKAGDHVIVSSLEHNAVMRPLNQLGKLGVTFDAAQADADGRLAIERIEALIRPQTKLVVMTHASNVCGTVLPIADAAALCRARGLRFVVDAAQTAGVLPLSMKELGADAIAFTGHKGILGPQGIGGMVLTDEFAAQIEPLLSGGTGSVSDTEQMPAFLPDRFESGTMNLPGIAGLHAALEYILETGTDRINQVEMELCSRFLAGVRALPGVRMVGVDGIQGRVATVSLDFSSMGLDNAVVSYRLDDEHGIMTRCGMHCAPRAHKTLGTFPQGTVRFAFGHKNTPDEVDSCLEALKDICKN